MSAAAPQPQPDRLGLILPAGAFREPPVPLASGGWLAFEGRLDNRDELWRALPGPRSLAVEPRDAELLAHAWPVWGPETFSRLLGSYAVALWDPARARGWLARDPMGGRTIYYAETPEGLQVAAEEAALLGPRPSEDQLDEAWLAAYFALTEPEVGATPWRGIRELPPGQLLEVTDGRLQRRPFWQPPDPAATPRWGRERWAEELRARLHQAVACRLDGPRDVGVLLSGGLDSTPIAAAARTALGPERRLVALSWAFERTPRADERAYFQAAASAYDMELHELPCDEDCPLGDAKCWPVHPATPEQNPYRRLHQRAYGAAAAAGAPVVLSGMCGDQLWSGSETWLVDLLRRGQGLRAVGDLAWHLRHPAAAGLSREVLRPLVPPAVLGVLRAWRGRRRPVHDWLTPWARERAPEPGAQARRYAAYPRPHQAELLLGAANGHGFAVERWFARQAGVEVRFPLRDQRLVELLVTAPTAEIYRRGSTRALLRRSFAGQLPEAIRLRRSKADFSALFTAGVYQRHRSQVGALLFAPDALWRRYVQPEWITRALARADLGRAGLVLWLAVSLELWRRRLEVP